MGEHWTDKRASVALIGAELRRRGWELFGWSDDQSDSMTDYYCPESWDGVARHPSGAVACVDVSRYTVESSSGGVERTRQVDAGPCERCQGGQAEPDGWTYQRAKEDPAGWNAYRYPDSICIFGPVVSPIPFFGTAPQGESYDYPDELHGREKCHACHGTGRATKTEHYREPWPDFQPNPARCSWHVEKDGRIIDRGTGVYTVRECNGHMEPFASKQAAKLARVCDRIEGAAGVGRPAPEPGQVAGEGVTVREGTRPGFVEVRFAAKPPLEQREELKRHGFRWARRSRCWYGPGSRLPERWGGPGEGHAPDIDRAAGL